MNSKQGDRSVVADQGPTKKQKKKTKEDDAQDVHKVVNCACAHSKQTAQQTQQETFDLTDLPIETNLAIAAYLDHESHFVWKALYAKHWPTSVQIKNDDKNGFKNWRDVFTFRFELQRLLHNEEVCMMCMYDRCMYDVYTDIGQYQYCFLILNQSYLCLHILCIKICFIVHAHYL